jgi:hypothetical protein
MKNGRKEEQLQLQVYDEIGEQQILEMHVIFWKLLLSSLFSKMLKTSTYKTILTDIFSENFGLLEGRT